MNITPVGYQNNQRNSQPSFGNIASEAEEQIIKTLGVKGLELVKGIKENPNFI